MSEKPVLVIKDGCVVTGDAKDTRFDRADIVIRGDSIVAIGPNAGATIANAETIDASDAVVMPGLIDAHLHSNEGFEQGAYDNLPLEPWLLQSYPPFGFPLLSSPKRSRPSCIRDCAGCASSRSRWCGCCRSSRNIRNAPCRGSCRRPRACA
jgi:hypothetical protein